MKIRGITEMAIMNIIAMKKYFIVIISSFTAIVITLLCFFSYRTAIGNKMEFVTSSKASKCYLEMSNGVPNKGTYDQLSSRYVRYEWASGLTPESIDLIVDGITYAGHDKKNYNFDIKQSEGLNTDDSALKVPFNICAVLKDNDELFPEMMLKELRVKTNILSPIKYGVSDLSKGHILISDFMLEQFGLTDEVQKNLVGKKITIKNKDDGTVYFSNLILSGIIDARLYYLESLIEIKAAHILISEADMCEQIALDMEKYIIFESKLAIGDYDGIDTSFNGHLCTYCYMKGFTEYKSLFKTLSDDGFDVSPSRESEMYYTINQQKIIVDYIVSVIIGVFSLTLFFYLSTALYFYHKRTSQFKYMLSALGMNLTNVFGVSFVELSISSIVSVFAGVAISLGIIALFNMFWSNESYVEIGFTDVYFCVVPCIMLVAFLVFSMIVATISTNDFSKHQLSSALNEE